MIPGIVASGAMGNVEIGLIEFVGSGQAIWNATTNYTFDMVNLLDEDGNPAVLQENDIIVIVFGYNSGGTGSDTSLSATGYTREFSVGYSSTNGIRASILYKFMSSVPDTSIELIKPGTRTNNRSAVVIFALRGVDTVQPFDIAFLSQGSGSGSYPTPPPITPETPGAVPLVCAFSCSGSNASNQFLRPISLSAGNNHWRNPISTGGTVRANTAAGLKFDWVSGEYACEIVYQSLDGVNPTTSRGQTNLVLTGALRPQL